MSVAGGFSTSLVTLAHASSSSSRFRACLNRWCSPAALSILTMVRPPTPATHTTSTPSPATNASAPSPSRTSMGSGETHGNVIPSSDALA